MKKLFFIITVGMFALSLNAQSATSSNEVKNPFKIGGSFGLSWIQNIGVDFTLSPEFSYDFNNHWGIGTSIAINVIGNQSGAGYAIVAAPYARYTPWRVGIFSLFLDLGGAVGGNNDVFMASVGVSPGLAFDFTDHFTFIANLGFVGYQYNMNSKLNVLGGGPHSVGIDLSSSNLSIGGFYRF